MISYIAYHPKIQSPNILIDDQNVLVADQTLRILIPSKKKTNPYPPSSFLNHIASLQAVLAAMYSASVVLWETEPCFLLYQEIIAEPKLKQYPEVLFRSTMLQPQSESVYPSNKTPPLEAYLSP